MGTLTLADPLVATWATAAAIVVLKSAAMSWLTVARMLQVNGGFRAPEDLQKTPFNPNPNEKQLDRDERVERVRRIHANDVENLPFFAVGSLLFVLSGPPLLAVQILLYGYVASRLLHFWAYFTAKTHDTRAKFWTVGSLALIGMTGWALVAAVRAQLG
jgi:glutathione S-transferase